MICSCGNEIPQGRVDFLKKYNKKINCINCAKGVQRVAGYMPSQSKMQGEIVICSQETAAMFHRASARTNGIVAQGVRTNRKS